MSALRPGDIVGERFEVLSLAGVGGMGEVYRVRHLVTGELHALKVLQKRTARRLDRFAREARVLAQLQHPGIVRYVDHGEVDGSGLFLVMEWLDGVDLGERLKEGPLPISDCLKLGIQVSAALSAAHARAVVHRDIKPANVFLIGGSVAHVKLLDFGVAWLGEERRQLTDTGEILGTPLYMAPELWRAVPDVDGRADVFAVGVLLYESITGRTPFSGASPAAVVAAVLESRPLPPSHHRADVPRALDDLVLRMLSSERASRPSDGRALLGELLAIGAGTSADAEGLRSELTATEEHLESVVLVMERARARIADAATIDPDDEATPFDGKRGVDTRDRKIVRALVDAQGGRLVTLTDGTLLLVVAEQRVATDQAVSAVRLALSVHRLAPDAWITVMTGRGVSQQKAAPVPFDESGVRERCQGVHVDDVTAGLLPGRFSVVGRSQGLFVVREGEGDESARLLLGRPAPFVGRERDLATLLALFDECVDGRRSRAALVSAPAGLGKSRLVTELFQALARRGRAFQSWVGRGDPLRMASPFALLGDAVRRTTDIRSGESLSIQLDKLRARVSRHLAPDRANIVAAFLGEMIGLPAPEDDECDALRIARRDPSVMADSIRRAWEEWLSAEAAALPVLLVLEDLHWGDASSVKLVERALLQEQPCFVLGLARPDAREKFPGLFSGHGLLHLDLPMLSRDQSAELVSAVLGDRVDTVMIERLVDVADGHPLYLEELIRHVADGHDESLPKTVVAMVQSRLEALEPEARRVLRAASIFGEDFWTGGVTALVGQSLSVDRVEAWLRVLADREVLERPPSSRLREHEQWTFRHALLRDAAYGLLTEEDRVLGHRLAGAWLSGVGEDNHALLAGHFERGRDWERAVHHLDLANQNAIRAEAMEEARRYFDAALELIQLVPGAPHVVRSRVTLVLRQLPVVLTLHDFPRYYEVLLEHEPYAFALGDDALTGTLCARIGESLWALGRFDESITRLDHAIALCEAANAHEEAGYAYQAWICSNSFRGSFEAALSAVPRLEAHMRVAPHARWHVYGLSLAALSLCWLGRWKESIACADRALAIAEASKQPGAISFAAWTLSHAHTYGGDVERALAAAKYSAEVALTSGDRIWAECTLAGALLRAHEPARAVELLSAALPMMRAASFAAGEVCAPVLGSAYLALGRPVEAESAVNEMLHWATKYGMPLNVGVAHRQLAEVALLASAVAERTAEATHHLESSLGILTRIGAEHERALAIFVLARVHERAGRIDEARRAFSSAERALTQLGSPFLPTDYQRLEARLSEPGN